MGRTACGGALLSELLPTRKLGRGQSPGQKGRPMVALQEGEVSSSCAIAKHLRPSIRRQKLVGNTKTEESKDLIFHLHLLSN